MVPLDFYLARRQITVQGRIPAEALDEYQKTLPSSKTPAAFAGGAPTELIIPFAVFPKRLLLDFSTADSTGSRVPMLTSGEDSAATALHLLALFPRAAFPTRRLERSGALLIFETLALLDPRALRDRLRAWRADESYHPQLSDFHEWFRHEAREFSAGLDVGISDRHGHALAARGEASPALILRDYLSPSAAEVLTGDFELLAPLVLFGVRDSFRILSRRQTRGGFSAQTPRQQELLREYRLLMPAGLRWLDRALRQSWPGRRVVRDAVRADVAQTAVSWMAYLQAQVALEQSFQLKSSELLPFARHTLARRQLIRVWTYHRYHVDPFDARSAHIEIATEDPELLIAHRASRVTAANWSGDRAKDAFQDHFSAAQSVAHFYSAANRWELPLRDARGPVELRVRYKLPNGLTAGYIVLSVALLALVTWSTIEWGGTPPDATAETALLTVVAGFTFLLTFLTTQQHRRPLVHGKVQPFRWLASLVLIALILEPALSWLGWI